ncbi:hypothetical protein ZWY2020_017705 [Hordeum vulgare]|nr:hypothetical protein ZWY2020_017705 [Hordeum vulgare]
MDIFDGRTRGTPVYVVPLPTVFIPPTSGICASCQVSGSGRCTRGEGDKKEANGNKAHRAPTPCSVGSLNTIPFSSFRSCACNPSETAPPMRHRPLCFYFKHPPVECFISVLRFCKSIKLARDDPGVIQPSCSRWKSTSHLGLREVDIN